MRKFLVGLLLASLATLGAVSSVSAVPLTGSISWEVGGIETNGTWASPETVLTWSVLDQENGTWKYRYMFAVPSPTNVGRLVIQTGESFTSANLLGVDPPGGTVTQVNMGHSFVFGIVWEGISCMICEFSFTSDVTPMWGSFAADGLSDLGEIGTAYNTEILGVSNTSIFWQPPPNFLLTPGIPMEVSEPTTVALLGAGLMFFWRRKRS